VHAPGRLPLVVVIGVAVLLLSGCSGRSADRSEDRPPARRLGGPPPTAVAPPQGAMSSIERTVAGQLARHLGRDGLTLASLDCPPWDEVLPHRMTCRGYVDGLVAHVRVDLTASAGDHVSFGARVTDGLVAVGELERTLRGHGWGAADCGDVAAYPARVGSRIRCRVSGSGRVRYVVATVEDRSGEVTIAAERGAPAG